MFKHIVIIVYSYPLSCFLCNCRVKDPGETTMDAFPLALPFIGALSERLPSKMDDTFCLSAAGPAEREKGKSILLAQ